MIFKATAKFKALIQKKKNSKLTEIVEDYANDNIWHMSTPILNKINCLVVCNTDNEKEIFKLKRSKAWDKKEIKELFNYMIPDFGHKETGKYLDNKM